MACYGASDGQDNPDVDKNNKQNKKLTEPGAVSQKYNMYIGLFLVRYFSILLTNA